MTTTKLMKIGITLPQNQIGADPSHLAAFAHEAESAGFDFLDVYEHVVGADVTDRPDWAGPYDLDSLFHEPFVMFGFLAAHTSSLVLSTSVLVLPQRQAVLVAKQAAEVDVLSGGRLRLGVGIGWNEVEYDALGRTFRDRAARYEEQITLLRQLWTQRSVSFEGDHERVEAAGLWPMPIQQPIPIWLGGGTAPPVLDRIGRLGDGWMSTVLPGRGLEEAMDVIHRAAERAGRDPDSIGLQGGVAVGDPVDRDVLRRHLDKWQAAGASDVVVTSFGVGRSPDQHVELVGTVGSAIADRG